MKVRRWFTAVCVLFLASSCSSTDNGAVPVVTESEVTEPDVNQQPDVNDSDVRLIMGLWDHLEQASQGGLDSWGQAVVNSQYTGFGATSEVCTHGVTNGESFRVAYDVERSSIKSEPEWMVPDFNPGSPMSGETPVGRTYSVSVRATFGGSPDVHESVEHVTVRDGEAFWFPICETD